MQHYYQNLATDLNVSYPEASIQNFTQKLLSAIKVSYPEIFVNKFPCKLAPPLKVSYEALIQRYLQKVTPNLMWLDIIHHLSYSCLFIQ